MKKQVKARSASFLGCACLAMFSISVSQAGNIILKPLSYQEIENLKLIYRSPRVVFPKWDLPDLQVSRITYGGFTTGQTPVDIANYVLNSGMGDVKTTQSFLLENIITVINPRDGTTMASPTITMTITGGLLSNMDRRIPVGTINVPDRIADWDILVEARVNTGTLAGTWVLEEDRMNNSRGRMCRLYGTAPDNTLPNPISGRVPNPC